MWWCFKMLILVPSNAKSYGMDDTWFIKNYSMSSMTKKEVSGNDKVTFKICLICKNSIKSKK